MAHQREMHLKETYFMGVLLNPLLSLPKFVIQLRVLTSLLSYAHSCLAVFCSEHWVWTHDRSLSSDLAALWSLQRCALFRCSCPLQTLKMFYPWCRNGYSWVQLWLEQKKPGRHVFIAALNGLTAQLNFIYHKPDIWQQFIRERVLLKSPNI